MELARESRFRAAVVVPCDPPPAWVRHVISALVHEGRVERLYVIVECEDRPRFTRGALSRLTERVGNFLYPVELDALALRFRDWGHLEAYISRRLPDPADLDLVLDFRLAGELSESLRRARYGVWRFRVDPGPATDPALFWERCRRAGTAELTWEALLADDTVSTLHRLVAAVDIRSPRLTMNLLYWKAAHVFVRELVQLSKRRPMSLSEALRPIPQLDSSVSLPSARGRAVGALAGLVGGALRRATEKVLWERYWSVGIGRREPVEQIGGFTAVTWLRPARRMFYADPCAVEHADGHTVFFETYDARKRRGVIACVDVRGERVSRPAVVLARDYHLSYPFVFRHGDEWFMVPETAANRTVELFRATRFPEEWRLERVLLAGMRAVDSTILAHGGRLWLFVVLADEGASTFDELFLYSAPSLDGRWQPHPMNPVVADVRRARSAGGCFSDSRGLIRPAQDCSGGYGRRVVLNRIERLTEEDYRERPIASIEPSAVGALATHCYSVAGRLQAIDGVRRRARLRRR